MEKRCTILMILCSLLITAATNASSNNESKDAEKWIEKYMCRSNLKQTKLHFYIQDALGGPNATVWEVARANITSRLSTLFGQVSVIDDLITAEPDRNSEKLGRLQGLLTSADLQESGLAMNINIVFTGGPHNGSTLSILGRNLIRTRDRELPVVGGTGDFRMAGGFAIVNSYSYDQAENYAVLEYTIYVFHV